MPDLRKTVPPEANMRLMAFAFADVASYARHMEHNSAAAALAWASLRDSVLLDEMTKRGGVQLSNVGDAVLVAFTSVTSAVSWALEVQERMQERHVRSNPMQIRISVNFDDVIDDGAQVQSEGIVVAARIHQLADPGSVVVTAQVRDLVRGKIGARFHDLGAPVLKNIGRPVQVYAAVKAERPSGLIHPHANWSARPSIAVLPFEDTGAPESERYFGEGITEEIISGVSRSRAMFVVARTSTLRYRGSRKNPREIGRELGVSYLLTGSVERLRGRLRIFSELMDVDRNRAVWAENYKGGQEDLFAFQEQIAANILAVLEPQVLSAAAANLSGRAPDSLDAYDCVLRALSRLYQLDGGGYAEAKTLLERAVALDPGYAQAHAYLAWCLNFWIAESHSRDSHLDILAAIRHSRRAVELDPGDALTLSIRAHVLSLHENKPEQALDLFEDALELNVNLPLAWALSAVTLAYLGDGEEARRRMLNVWQLAPYDPLNFFFLAAAGLAAFVSGCYGEAVRHLKRARRYKPRFVAASRLLAAALAQSGRMSEAAAEAETVLELEPAFTVSDFITRYPLRPQDTRDKLARGLELAGLPP